MGEVKSEESKKVNKKKTLIGCSVLLVVFIILAVAIGTCLGGSEDSETTEPAPVAPAPGPTPSPVPGPAAPAPAPEKPALTTTEQAYANAVGDQATTVGKALTNFSLLLQNPKYGNDEWTLQVAAQLVIIRMVYDEAMELDPPSSMAEIHLKYTQGMKAYNDMTYLFSRGVDELDLDLIDQAVTKMET